MLGMKENVLATKNENEDGEINLGREIQFQKTFMGKNDQYKPQNRESLFPATEQHKNGFPAMEK